MLTEASSGRAWAAWMNLRTFPARKARSRPARSSSTMVTPPEVPMPGIAGGGKAKPMASGMAANSRFSRAMMAAAFSSGACRSSHGFREMKKNPL